MCAVVYQLDEVRDLFDESHTYGRSILWWDVRDSMCEWFDMYKHRLVDYLS